MEQRSLPAPIECGCRPRWRCRNAATATSGGDACRHRGLKHEGVICGAEDGWKVRGSQQPFSVGRRQGRQLPQSCKPKAGCVGSIPAAPLLLRSANNDEERLIDLAHGPAAE